MSLPEPDDAALAISRELTGRIVAEIRQTGWMPFPRFMEKVLYEPALGYYSAGSAKFGQAGDFVTAPELTPLFGLTLARQVGEVLAQTGGVVLEAGAGSGALACDLLTGLQAAGQLPEQYLILEVSADLRERQQQRVARRLPHLQSRVTWIERLPEQLTGCVVANELLDAMPVHLVHWRDDGLFERGVALDEQDQFIWQERLVDDPVLAEQAHTLPATDGMLSEIGLAGQAWVRELGQRLVHGALLLIDYGFGEREYYHSQRQEGTLMCHYRQHAHADPFFLPGLQDVTAHVDFTAITLAGKAAGLRLAGYTAQAQFLLNCGITRLLEQTDPQQPACYLPQSAAVQKLLSPAEMGELFKVLALTRGELQPLTGFAAGDQRRRL